MLPAMTQSKHCPKTFNTIIECIDSVNEFVGKAVSWLTFLLVIFVTIDVIMRYGFNISFVALEELHWHLYALIFLLGAGYTLKQNGHVRVDVIYQRLPRRARALINVLGTLFFLFPGCYLVIKTSIPFVKASWMMHEGSPDPGGLPARYLLKAVIPISFAFLALQGVSMLLTNICVLFGLDTKRKDEV